MMKAGEDVIWWFQNKTRRATVDDMSRPFARDTWQAAYEEWEELVWKNNRQCLANLEE